MSNEISTSRPKWQRPIIGAIVFVMLGVAGISAWTNIARQTDPARADTPAPAKMPSLYKTPASGPAAALPQGFEALEIRTSTGAHAFAVEVMRTDAERGKGLMFRQSMAADRGMLFDFKADFPVTMWMKNTYIPLDMVFIRADGSVHRIERGTEPHSERTISSGDAVRAVLELNAGESDKIGLKPGDKIIHAMFPAK